MPDKKPRWRVVCSCGWEREASSARADASRRPLVVNSLGTSIDVGIRYQYTVHQDSPTRAEATLQVVPVPSEAVALASHTVLWPSLTGETPPSVSSPCG